MEQEKCWTLLRKHKNYAERDGKDLALLHFQTYVNSCTWVVWRKVVPDHIFCSFSRPLHQALHVHSFQRGRCNVFQKLNCAYVFVNKHYIHMVKKVYKVKILPPIHCPLAIQFLFLKAVKATVVVSCMYFQRYYLHV